MVFPNLILREEHLNELENEIISIQKECDNFINDKDNKFVHERLNRKRKMHDKQVDSFDSTILLTYIADIKTLNNVNTVYPFLQESLFDYFTLKRKLNHKDATKGFRCDLMGIDNNTYEKYISNNIIPAKCFIGLIEGGYISISELLLALKINGIDIMGLSRDVIKLRKTIFEFYGI